MLRLHPWVSARDTTSLGFSGSPAYGNRSLEGRGCQPPSRAHPVHFHASGGPILSRTTSVALPSFFHPGNAPELSPFRALILPESRGPFPNPILPCRFESQTANRPRCAASKVCSLWKSASRSFLFPGTPGYHALLVVLGLSGVFPSAAVETSFPVSSPFALGMTRRPRPRSPRGALGFCRTADRFRA